MYARVEPGDKETDLCQGDIIAPRDELRHVFEGVHSHFTDVKYTGFLVLTQTCDLVRRGGRACTSRYINLAVIRPLKDVLLSLLDRACEKVEIGGRVLEGVYLSDDWYKGKQLLERVFKQNAQSEGVFYLPTHGDVELSEDSVALLQVSVALRTHEHYDTLRRARTTQLKEPFRSKLGWLAGNLFARVATSDPPKAELARLSDSYIGSGASSLGLGVSWVPLKQIKAAKRGDADISSMTREQVLAHLEQHQPTPPRERAIDQILRTISGIVSLSDEDSAALRMRLENDNVLESLIKRN